MPVTPEQLSFLSLSPMHLPFRPLSQASALSEDLRSAFPPIRHMDIEFLLYIKFIQAMDAKIRKS